MLKLSDTPLPGNALRWLRKWQANIDSLPDYAARVAEAKRVWSVKNRKDNATFDAVKQTLWEMHGCLRRCAYCEDSCADEVEHIRPKDLYPEFVFVWENYLYACGICNVEKRNNYAVFVGGTTTLQDVKRVRNTSVAPPLGGDPVLIDPRREDPLDFLILDLRTFQFIPLANSGTREYIRAEYTIETLGLWREPLREARENAARGFLARLTKYVHDKDAGEPSREQDKERTSLLRAPHQTVWREMQRQPNLSPKLAELFAAAPEALAW